MALTITVEKTIQLESSEQLYLGSVTFDSSYPTGGEAFDLPGNAIAEYVFTDGLGGYVTGWDRANQKLKLYRQTNPAAAGGADVALIEFTNAGDASAVVLSFKAYGQ